MKVAIPFRVIQHNITPEGEEIVFPYGDRWYRCPISKVPEKYFKLRDVYLWIEEGKTVNRIVRLNLNVPPIVEIDLEECEEITETYPI